MTSKSEWQEANRELIAEQRRALGDPPTAEEMLAFSRGELSESEEERIRDLIAVYPELARMYNEPFPEEGDEVTDDEMRSSWEALQQRLGKRSGSTIAREEAQRGRVVFMRYIPTAVAAMLAVVFFGLFVRAEKRARYFADESRRPRVLGIAQQLDPNANRGPEAATVLEQDGEVYLLQPTLSTQVHYPHYQLDLRDENGALLWENRDAKPVLENEVEVFRIAVPHELFQPGETYQLRIFGLDGGSPRELGIYRVSAPAE
jgi:hypothetical protein